MPGRRDGQRAYYRYQSVDGSGVIKLRNLSVLYWIGLTLVFCAGPLLAQTVDADTTEPSATEPYAGVTWAHDMGPGPETVPKNTVARSNSTDNSDNGNSDSPGHFSKDPSTADHEKLVAAGAPWESLSFPTALIWGLLGGFIGAALFVKGQGRFLKTGQPGSAGKGANVQLKESQDAVLSALRELEMMATRWKEVGMQPVNRSHPTPEEKPRPSRRTVPERKSGSSRPAGRTASQIESLGFANDARPLPEHLRLDERPVKRQAQVRTNRIKEQVQVRTNRIKEQAQVRTNGIKEQVQVRTNGIKEQVQELLLQGEGVEQIARELRISRESVRLFFQSDTEFSGPKSRKVMNRDEVDDRKEIDEMAKSFRQKFSNPIKNKRLPGGR